MGTASLKEGSLRRRFPSQELGIFPGCCNTAARPRACPRRHPACCCEHRRPKVKSQRTPVSIWVSWPFFLLFKFFSVLEATKKKKKVKSAVDETHITVGYVLCAAGWEHAKDVCIFQEEDSNAQVAVVSTQMGRERNSNCSLQPDLQASGSPCQLVSGILLGEECVWRLFWESVLTGDVLPSTSARTEGSPAL